jgi:hypothetical protein
MNLQERKQILIYTGEKIKTVLENNNKNFPGFDNIAYHNPWFTEEFVRYCLNHWANLLNANIIDRWLSNYNALDKESSETVLALIPAGNIPFVGLHDILCAIATGIKLKIKLSSKDKLLNEWLIIELKNEFPLIREHIQVCDNLVDDFDAIIATGSDNTNRYFEYYFGKYPNILRKNRNSLAILSGNETSSELETLTDDIFVYFGMGCRSVSKIFVPLNYDFTELFKAFRKYDHLKYHNKYANNYDYQTAICQLNKTDYYNAGNALLIENHNLPSPIAVINFSYYNNFEEIHIFVDKYKQNIQCIVTNLTNFAGNISFGSAQKPQIDDFADGIDTIDFLTNLQNKK